MRHFYVPALFFTFQHIKCFALQYEKYWIFQVYIKQLPASFTPILKQTSGAGNGYVNLTPCRNVGEKLVLLHKLSFAFWMVVVIKDGVWYQW
jgi:hypothetical protein